MALTGTIDVTGLNQWMDLTDVPELADVESRCTPEAIQAWLDEHSPVPNVRAVSARVNRDGAYQSRGIPNSMIMAIDVADLPPFCEVLLEHRTGKHTEHIDVWVPLQWCGRFVGCGGGGTRTYAWLPETFTATLRTVYLPRAVRNGFACACTDGGVKTGELYGWGVDPETGAYDRELHQNLCGYSTHTMAQLGQAVTEAITGEKPQAAYFMGSSGGGRQALVEAQRHANDFDGIWADCPAIYMNRMIVGAMWPAVVMKDLENPMAPAKFEAFRDAVVEKAGGEEALAESRERVEIDPFALVGTETEAGPITDTDALAMQKIWEGPRTPDGQWLWHGMRPGARGWTPLGYASCAVAEDGTLSPAPPQVSRDPVASWLVGDPAWDWIEMTMENFADWMRRMQATFPEMDGGDPDLRSFRDAGGKLIITHGTDDPAIYVDDTIGYWDQVCEAFGGEERAMEAVRMFIIPGDGHGDFAQNGHGPSTATGMAALMDWVENGNAPESLAGQRVAPMTAEVLQTGETPLWRQ